MARILVVDDDPGFAYAVARHLRADGHEVVVCAGPIEALVELESTRTIDMLVSDVRLPEGTPHGFSLGRMAKLRRPDLPVLFMTGHPEVIQHDRTPPGPVMFKPFEMTDLGAAVLAHLGERPRHRL